MSQPSGLQKFIEELRRRHVPQTAAVYLVAAWAAIEFSDVVVPNLNGPQWVVTAVIIAAIVGFPITLVLAWIFDWGPEGLHRTGDLPESSAGTRGAGAAPATSAPWAAALAVLVVAIASALAVAAVLAGGDDAGSDAEAPAARNAAEAGSGERGDASEMPGAPAPPPALVPPGPGYGDSIRNQVLRGLGEMEGLAGMAVLRDLENLDSMDLSDFREIARRMATEAGLQVLVSSPEEWRLGVEEPVRLAPGDTLVVEGLAQDSAGIVSVSVDGKVVEELDPPERTLRFQAFVVGTGSAGSRSVPIVVRTVDGREIRQEHEVVQRAGGGP